MIRGLREGALIIFGTTALYLLASLSSYDVSDPGWSHSESVNNIANAGGVLGAWLSDVFLYLCMDSRSVWEASLGWAPAGRELARKLVVAEASIQDQRIEGFLHIRHSAVELVDEQ